MRRDCRQTFLRVSVETADGQGMARLSATPSY